MIAIYSFHKRLIPTPANQYMVYKPECASSITWSSHGHRHPISPAKLLRTYISIFLEKFHPFLGVFAGGTWNPAETVEPCFLKFKSATKMSGKKLIYPRLIWILQNFVVLVKFLC